MTSTRLLNAALIVAGLGAARALVGADVPTVPGPQAAMLSGDAVYAKYCASCHDQVGARIPTRDALTTLSPARMRASAAL